MQAKFQQKRLQQARYFRGKTLAELGAEINITRQSLSQFERGERTPAPETLLNMAQALNVPTEFFLRPMGRLENCARSLINYRSLNRTREIIREQQRAEAILDFCAAITDTLEDHVEYQDATVPKFCKGHEVVSMDMEDIENVAINVRKKLGLGEGPISDVTLLVENQSVVVINTPLPKGMDGFSAWYGDRPFIVVSSEASYARCRMNIAHEYGHLVLHHDVSVESELDDETFKIVEAQAWRFAGAFMLPAKSFLSEIYSVSLDALVILKNKWGVSIAAMIRRLSDLGVIDTDQYRYLNIQLRQRGWQKNEPGDNRKRETARLINRAASFLEQSGEIPIYELASRSKLPRDFLASALELNLEDLLPPAPKNVLQFKLKNG